MPYEQESMECSFLQWGLKRETTKLRIPKINLRHLPTTFDQADSIPDTSGRLYWNL